MVIRYVTLLVLLAIAILGSLTEMGTALFVEMDLENFSKWTCITSIFALLAGYVVKLTPAFLAAYP
ncbi:MAG: hypothetical protein MUF49_05605 [Oculatellaceae cyanobacterium Prado106]|jgi:hypothetical protein|nr:hypothetical protein [Oculatellaceae cyanobacterium Prado106]